jgi:hypothetical protein
MMNPPHSRPSRGPPLNTSFRSPSVSGSASHSGEFQPPTQTPPSYGTYSSPTSAYPPGPSSQGPVLPPFSSIQAMGAPGNVSSVRYHPSDSQRQYPRSQYDMTAGSSTSSKRPAPSSSNVTSADSTDYEDEDNGELPASGLVAPWEVLRGLADVAIERAAKVGVIGNKFYTSIC